MQNGLDVSDVSRVSPDHNVATTMASATQVEVLRGPATLQYGSGAIGGVVNVVDKRIPQYQVDGVEGEAEMSYSTVNEGKYTRGDITGGQGNFVWHLDGFLRDTDNADIPGFASVEPDEDEEREPVMKDVEVVAWYAPEIPVNNGPANYHGLPGLILEVSAGNTTMLCTKIVMNPEEKLEIQAPEKGKEVTKTEYQETIVNKMKEFRNNRVGRRRG